VIFPQRFAPGHRWIPAQAGPLLFLTPYLVLAGPASAGAPDDADAFRVISTKAIGAAPSALVPGYVSTLSQRRGQDGFGSPAPEQDWLLLGLQARGRVESLDRYYRQASLPSDEGFYTRVRAYIGIREILDPFRFTIELADARRLGIDRFAPTTSEMDHLGFLQAYAELHFDDALFGLPSSFSAGRFSFDAVDRRLIARNRYRNTANAFDGVRWRVGNDQSLWEATVFALRPVRRGFDPFDNVSQGARLFCGGYATFRARSPEMVLEPYYFYLEDERNPATARQLHTAGLHAFGELHDGFFDYDLSAAAQWGDLGGLDHAAHAIHAEIACNFRHPWRPRLALWVNYGSGDADPNDGNSGRFAELFGAPFGMYGFTRYFTWENTLSPVISISFRPAEKIRVEFLLRSYLLARKRDVWVRARDAMGNPRQDPTGSSGRHVGEEVDVRVRWQPRKGLLIDTGVGHFMPGSFVEGTGQAPDSTLIYFQAQQDF
jgi:hypothetical protein